MFDQSQIKIGLALLTVISAVTTVGIDRAIMKERIEVAQREISANKIDIKTNTRELGVLRTVTHTQAQIDENQNEIIRELKETIVRAERVSF